MAAGRKGGAAKPGFKSKCFKRIVRLSRVPREFTDVSLIFLHSLRSSGRSHRYFSHVSPFSQDRSELLECSPGGSVSCLAAHLSASSALAVLRSFEKSTTTTTTHTINHHSHDFVGSYLKSHIKKLLRTYKKMVLVVNGIRRPFIEPCSRAAGRDCEPLRPATHHQGGPP